jgi:hypothetical protein
MFDLASSPPKFVVQTQQTQGSEMLNLVSPLSTMVHEKHG